MLTTVLHTPELSPSQREIVLDAIPGELQSRHHHYRLYHEAAPAPDALAGLRERCAFDVNPLPAGFSPGQVRLLMTDMDSTLINIECVDEIADFAGRKAEVAAVTEAAMRGEIDFATSLTRRVAALKGLDERVLARVYDERLRLNPGAERLVEGLRERGVRTALVSGGFTFFTRRLQARLDLDFSLANVLETREGRLTGRVLGEIVGAEAKAAFLGNLCDELGIRSEQAIAMGDGANDLKMLQAAGLGVAYRAKPTVQAQADVVFNHSGLDGVLELLEG